MTDPDSAVPRSSLFARKGEATAAPAVGYTSVRALQGKPERREGDRREGTRSDDKGSDRRRTTFERLFGKPKAPKAAPEAAPEATADVAADVAADVLVAPEERAPEPMAGAAPSPLSSLIRRHCGPTPRPPAGVPARPPRLEPATPPPAPAPARQHPEARESGKRHQLTVRVEEGDFERLERLVEKSGRTKQDVLAKALDAYLE